MAFYAQEFTDAAKLSLRVAEQLDPREARWPYFQGLIMAESDPENAFEKLERAANLCADAPDAPRLQLGELLLAHGQLDRAADQFERILQRTPDNARAHLGMGRVAFLKGDLRRTQSHLAFSVSAPHTQKAAHFLSAQVHERLGNKAEAEKEYRHAASVQNEPGWPDPYLAEAQNCKQA
jgi:tetratricopeptide (TPR) repeat protein